VKQDPKERRVPVCRVRRGYLVRQDPKGKQDLKERPGQGYRERPGCRARQDPKGKQALKERQEHKASPVSKVPQVHRVPLECRVRRVPKV